MDLAQIKTLQDAGYTLDYALKTAFEADASAKGLDSTGPYVVDSALRKGLVTVKFEQNTSVDASGGQQVTVQYQPVCVVEGPSGRAACNATDTDLIIRLGEELA